MARGFLFGGPSLAPMVPKGTATTGSTRMITVRRCGESDDKVAAEKSNDNGNGEATHFFQKRPAFAKK